MLCSESTVVNSGEGEERAVTLFCRSWSCDICQPKRQSQLRALAANGDPSKFITLTANPATASTPASRARALVDAWRTVVKRAKKRYGWQKLPYLCVFEATKRGEPHLHILARCGFIEQRWLSAQMAELVRAPIVDIRAVHGKHQVANYITKYVGKAPHQFETCKRYWCTRDYEVEKWEREPEPGRWQDRWCVEPHSLESQVATWKRKGWGSYEREGMAYGYDPWASARRSYLARKQLAAPQGSL